jgi:hypothetical protein
MDSPLPLSSSENKGNLKRPSGKVKNYSLMQVSLLVCTKHHQLPGDSLSAFPRVGRWVTSKFHVGNCYLVLYLSWNERITESQGKSTQSGAPGGVTVVNLY